MPNAHAEDIAIVGVGDIALGDLLRVPLSTVGWSRDTQGRQAGELILDRIENGGANKFRRITVPPHLIAGRSTGAGT